MQYIIAKQSNNIDKITYVITKLATKSDKGTTDNDKLDVHEKVFVSEQEYLKKIWVKYKYNHIQMNHGQKRALLDLFEENKDQIISQYTSADDEVFKNV